MLNTKIRQLISLKFGTEIRYPQQCEVLAMDIAQVTGQTLGTTTLKRMLGFVGGTIRPRAASLDILSRYLGFYDYNQLKECVERDTCTSDFKYIDRMDAADMGIDERIRIKYFPSRVIELTYLGSNRFVINKAEGTKLLVGDILTITGFYIGFELIISDVERNGRHLGSYQAAKQGGLLTIETF